MCVLKGRFIYGDADAITAWIKLATFSQHDASFQGATRNDIDTRGFTPGWDESSRWDVKHTMLTIPGFSSGPA